MADPFIAEIRIFPFDFAPKGWATCDGQVMPITQNTALWSLLGTWYGGDGKTTFGLPDLRGSAVMGQGDGPGLSSRTIGETGGTANAWLLTTQMPSHQHALRADTADTADTNDPGKQASAAFAQSSGGTLYQGNSNAALADQAIAPAGGDQPHNNMQPYLTCNFNIALQGVFPPRT
jgi:microcystin-dependent protein